MKIKFQEHIEVIKTAFGIILIMLSILINLSFLSFYIYWGTDQTEIYNIFDYNTKTNNLIGNLGAFLGNFFIQKRIGLSAFIIPITLFLIGIKILINKTIVNPWKYISHSIFIIIWFPIFLGYFPSHNCIFSGIYGFKGLEYLKKITGNIGTIVLLIISFLIYIIFLFKISYKNLKKNSYSIYLKFKKNIDKYNDQIRKKNQIYNIHNINKKKNL